MTFNRIAYKQYRCQAADVKLTPTDGAGSILIIEDRDLMLRWTGLIWRPILSQSPSRGIKHGIIIPNLTTFGFDALADLVLIGTGPVVVYDPTGTPKQLANYSASSVAGQKGWRMGSNNPTTLRTLNPYLSSRVRPGSDVTVMRFYMGWTSSATTLPMSDTPLNNLHGLLVGFRAADTNYMIFHNGGLASEPAPIATASTKTASQARTIEIIADDATPKFSVSINGATLVNATTDIPATTQELYFHFVWELISGTAAHAMYHLGTEFFDGL
jgi:hypothetical protein